jgi:hypothetical protein
MRQRKDLELLLQAILRDIDTSDLLSKEGYDLKSMRISEEAIEIERLQHERTRLDSRRTQLRAREAIGKMGLETGFGMGRTERVRKTSAPVILVQEGARYLNYADEIARDLGIATLDDVAAHRQVRPSRRKRS